MTTLDPELRAKHNRTYYEKNKVKRLEYNYAVRKRNTEYVQQIKEETPCADCGKNFPYYVMDFDHLGDKETEISKMANQRLVSLKKLQEEIDKCEVVCANCHRQRTHNRGRALVCRSLS